jgi:hypothetical protein
MTPGAIWYWNEHGAQLSKPDVHERFPNRAEVWRDQAEHPGPSNQATWRLPGRTSGKWEQRVRLTTNRSGTSPQDWYSSAYGLSRRGPPHFEATFGSWLGAVPSDWAIWPGRRSTAWNGAGNSHHMPLLDRPAGAYEVALAVDLDAGKIWFGIDGVYSGDPAAGTGEMFSNVEPVTVGSRTYNYFFLGIDLYYPGDTYALLPPVEWAHPGVPGFTPWVQWPSISGVAITAQGNPVDEVRLLTFDRLRWAGTAKPQAGGAWTAQVPPGMYWALYLAAGCAPALHGPYHVED